MIKMSKAEIMRLGKKLGVDYSLSVSCYDPSDDGLACGHCDSCLIRMEGFKEANIADPTCYSETSKVSS